MSVKPRAPRAVVKLVGAIVTTVLAGLIVFYLTRPGSLLNPEKKPVADLHILGTEGPVGNWRIGEGVTMKFTVYNDGDANAKGCHIYWISGEAYPPNEFFITSGLFDLDAGQKRIVRATSRPYDSRGGKESKAWVGCANIFNYRLKIHEMHVDFTVR